MRVHRNIAIGRDLYESGLRRLNRRERAAATRPAEWWIVRPAGKTGQGGVAVVTAQGLIGNACSTPSGIGSASEANCLTLFARTPPFRRPRSVATSYRPRP